MTFQKQVNGETGAGEVQRSRVVSAAAFPTALAAGEKTSPRPLVIKGMDADKRITANRPNAARFSCSLVKRGFLS